MFQRSDDYMAKITFEALDKEVYLDIVIKIVWDKGKYRAWCEETSTWLQFPNHLRDPDKQYYADIIKAQRGTDAVFYRAVKGSIRRKELGKNSDPVA